MIEEFVSQLKKFEKVYIQRIIELHDKVREANLALLISNKELMPESICEHKIVNRWFDNDGNLKDDDDVANMSVANEFSGNKKMTLKPYAYEFKPSLQKENAKQLIKIKSCHKLPIPSGYLKRSTPLHEISNTYGNTKPVHRAHSRFLFK